MRLELINIVADSCGRALLGRRGRPSISRTVREQSEGRCGRRPLSVSGPARAKASFRPGGSENENAAPCGAAPAADCIARRGRDSNSWYA